MFSNMSDITVIAGHYGSGKTEFSVNLAFDLAKASEKVMLLDLDIVNPYFCSRDQEQQLLEAGIDFIAPSPQCRIADVPALPAEINKIFVPNNGKAILDVGGDGAGAKVLSQFMPRLNAKGYDMWLVLNANRPQTADADKAMDYITMIETSSRLKFTGIINNTHLCGLTTADDVAKGSEVSHRLSEKSGLPLICSTVPSHLLAELEKKHLTEPLFPIEIRMKKPWEI